MNETAKSFLISLAAGFAVVIVIWLFRILKRVAKLKWSSLHNMYLETLETNYKTIKHLRDGGAKLLVWEISKEFASLGLVFCICLGLDALVLKPLGLIFPKVPLPNLVTSFAVGIGIPTFYIVGKKLKAMLFFEEYEAKYFKKMVEHGRLKPEDVPPLPTPPKTTGWW
jgi:hypothetical protein